MGVSATQVQLSQNILPLAQQYTIWKLVPINNYHLSSVAAPQVSFTQNQSTLATRNCALKLISLNHNNFDSTHASRVRFTQNQLTPTQRNSSSFLESHNTQIKNSSFLFYTNFKPNDPSLATDSTNTNHSALNNKAQIQNFESRYTNQASLAHQNPLQLNKIKLSNLSITNKSNILFLINTKNSNSLNLSRAQLKTIKRRFLPNFNFNFSRLKLQLSQSTIPLN